ncbi:MAG: hypothetical protein WB778_09810 [Thermoplasmata archaeon]
MERWPPPRYQIQIDFHAPLDFVYRWCTDYGSDDARRSGDEYERRVVQRTSRRVVIEDLWWESDGWRWRRSEVMLRPPNRWEAMSFGNVRDARIEYHLTALSPDRTRLNLRMRRRPGVRNRKQAPKKAMEEELRHMWGKFGKSLEKDYQRSRDAGSVSKRTGRSRRKI